ncbi:MAG: glycosyltransferase family 4 protein [Methylophilaceae bacterium]
MKTRGFDIGVYATRRCPEEQLLCESDVKEHSQTNSILPVSPFTFIAVNLKLLASNPARYLSTLFVASKHRLPGLKNLLWSFLQFFEAMLLADMLKQDDVKHLHVHFGNAGANICYFAARYLHLSWSMTLHGTSCFDYPSGQLLEEKIEHCTFANCISYFGLSQAFRQSNPEHWHKLFVTRCGIEPSVVNEVFSNKQPNNSDVINLIYVGRLSPEKGVNILIQALSTAVKEVRNIKLMIVGDGPRRAFLEEDVQQYNLSNHIEFVGAVPEREVFDRMSACDILVMSSFMEGIPMVLMEAMALELPVIAPRVAGIPELVIDQENGLLFDPANAEQLSSQIVRLAKEKELRAELGKQGRKKVLNEYSINKAVEKLSDKFKQMIE